MLVVVLMWFGVVCDSGVLIVGLCLLPGCWLGCMFGLSGWVLIWFAGYCVIIAVLWMFANDAVLILI